jgi:hypothetical protein
VKYFQQYDGQSLCFNINESYLCHTMIDNPFASLFSGHIVEEELRKSQLKAFQFQFLISPFQILSQKLKTLRFHHFRWDLKSGQIL